MDDCNLFMAKFITENPRSTTAALLGQTSIISNNNAILGNTSVDHSCAISTVTGLSKQFFLCFNFFSATFISRALDFPVIAITFFCVSQFHFCLFQLLFYFTRNERCIILVFLMERVSLTFN